MGIEHKAPTALVFQGIMTQNQEQYTKVLQQLVAQYGPVLEQVGPMDFSARTHYYEKEMGDRLQKYYVLFRDAVTTERAWLFKKFSQVLESEYLINGNRSVNVDPGILTQYNFSLFSTKGFSHRIYLSEGIYSELTLIRKGGKWEYLPWTYPDYKDTEVLDLLNTGRKQI